MNGHRSTSTLLLALLVAVLGLAAPSDAAASQAASGAAKPDLRVLSADIDQNAISNDGDFVSGTARVRNAGTKPAAGVAVAVFLRATRLVPKADAGTIAPGRTVVVRLHSNVRRGTDLGHGNLKVCADPDHLIPESNESNNCHAAGTALVYGKIWYRVTSLTGAELVEATETYQSGDISCTVKVHMDDPADVHYTAQPGGDLYLEMDKFGDVSGGAWFQGTVNVPGYTVSQECSDPSADYSEHIEADTAQDGPVVNYEGTVDGQSIELQWLSGLWQEEFLKHGGVIDCIALDAPIQHRTLLALRHDTVTLDLHQHATRVEDPDEATHYECDDSYAVTIQLQRMG